MTRLFDRAVKVIAAQQPSPTSFVGRNSQFFETIESGVEITQHRIEFDVTKNLGSEPNKCQLKIFNLNASTRAVFDRKPTKVTLLAGYDGAPRLLFTGDLVYAYTKREKADLVTTITVADGIRAYASARTNKTYKPPMTALRMIQDVVKTMGGRVPDELLQNSALKESISISTSAHGPSRDILNRELARYGYSWSFQNGRFQALRDEDVHPGERILVNASTGLLESPEVTPPKDPTSGGGKPTEIKFKMLLYPELSPGSEVQLESELLNATAKLIDVHHVGNNKNGDGAFVSECTTKVSS